MTSYLVRIQNAIADRQDERGAAMAEYGLLLAFIALAAIVVLSLFGITLKGAFETTNQTFEDNAPVGALGPGGGSST